MQKKKTKKQKQDFIKQFIDETVEKAGFSHLPQNFVDSYKERLEASLAKRIGVQATSILDEKAMAKFTAMLRKNPKTSSEKIFQFYSDNIENFPEKVAEILYQFQEEYLQTAQSIRREQ